MLKTVLLSGVAAFVIAVDWLRFEEPRSGGGRPFVLAFLAVAPVLLRPLWLRFAAVAISALLAAWVAFSVSPLAAFPGGDGFFGPLGSKFSRGFLDFYEFRLPIVPTEHPQMHAVILIAIFAFTLAVALAVAARRALLAVVLFFVAAGWPATLLSGGNELGRGLAILAVALALLAGMTERPSRLALFAAAAVLGGALALSSSPAVAKSAFLDWEHWDFYTQLLRIEVPMLPSRGTRSSRRPASSRAPAHHRALRLPRRARASWAVGHPCEQSERDGENGKAAAKLVHPKGASRASQRLRKRGRLRAALAAPRRRAPRRA